MSCSAALIDRGMWAGLVERALRSVHAETVECETHSCLDGDGTCAVIAVTVAVRLEPSSSAISPK